MASFLDINGFRKVWSEITNTFLKKTALVTVKNVTVSASSFVETAEYLDSDYQYRAAIVISGVTADQIPTVTPDASTQKLDVLGSLCQSYDGGVYVFANAVPSADCVFTSIVLTKGTEI